jgi:glycosyltransferase involved in cell wall biosynthesis
MMQAIEPVISEVRLNEYLQWNELATTNPTKPKATIAICTRNRTDDLKRCLNALQKLPDDGQEVLVIDNAPPDDSTKKLCEAYPFVTYIMESKPGLDFARNRALQEAAGDIIAFTDDDATPDLNWLRAITKNFSDPSVLCVTGMTMPLELETEAQEAFEHYSPFGKGFKRKVYSSDTHNPLAVGQVGAGANMALRKSVLKLIGPFDEALDAGTPTESGGDHEYFARILLAGYKIAYEPEALSWHRHRRTWQETRKAIRGYGIGVHAFWTRLLLVEKQTGILKYPYAWFIREQLPNVFSAIFKRPGSKPFHLLWAELKGCMIGPWKYFQSKRKVKRIHAQA